MSSAWAIEAVSPAKMVVVTAILRACLVIFMWCPLYESVRVSKMDFLRVLQGNVPQGV